MTENNNATATVLDETQFVTERASRYLQQLCKHFGHKVPAECDAYSGKVSFPFGECALKAAGDTLYISIAAGTDDDSARLADVIERHLARFAFREDITLHWSSGRTTRLVRDSAE